MSATKPNPWPCWLQLNVVVNPDETTTATWDIDDPELEGRYFEVMGINAPDGINEAADATEDEARRRARRYFDMSVIIAETGRHERRCPAPGMFIARRYKITPRFPL